MPLGEPEEGGQAVTGASGCSVSATLMMLWGRHHWATSGAMTVCGAVAHGACRADGVSVKHVSWDMGHRGPRGCVRKCGVAWMPAGNVAWTPKVQVCVSQGPGCPWLAQEGHPLLHPHAMDAGPLPSLAFRAQSQQMQLHSGPWLSSASPKDGPPDMLGGSLGLLDPRPMAMCTS